MQATTTEDEKALSPMLCFAKFYTTDGQNMRDQITRDRRPKRMWSNCIPCIPLILCGNPKECWLHTCDTCVITTWRLGLRVLLVARRVLKGYASQQETLCSCQETQAWVCLQWLDHCLSLNSTKYKNISANCIHCKEQQINNEEATF